jgi:hypothetical protein
MTTAESNPGSKSKNKAVSKSLNRPWANEWCLDAESYQNSDQALQAFFTRSDEINPPSQEDPKDFPANEMS